MHVTKLIIIMIVGCLSSTAEGSTLVYGSDKEHRVTKIVEIEEYLNKSNDFDVLDEYEELHDNLLFQHYSVLRKYNSDGDISSAISHLKTLASKNLTASMMQIGYWYYNDKLGKDPNNKLALTWFKKAVELKNEPEAMLLIALILKSRGKLEQQVFEYLNLAKSTGYPKAYRVAAIICSEVVALDADQLKSQCDPDEDFSKAIELGDTEAALKYSVYQIMGLSKKYTKNVGIESIIKFANDGVAEAQRILGQHYLHGILVNRDENKALELFKLAASNFDHEAQYYLGRILAQQVNSESSLLEAEKWLVQAAMSGNKEYLDFLSKFYISFEEAYPEYKEKAEKVKILGHP